MARSVARMAETLHRLWVWVNGRMQNSTLPSRCKGIGLKSLTEWS